MEPYQSASVGGGPLDYSSHDTAGGSEVIESSRPEGEHLRDDEEINVDDYEEEVTDKQCEEGREKETELSALASAIVSSSFLLNEGEA